MKTFEEAWAATGRQYGPEELEGVHLGWEMAEAELGTEVKTLHAMLEDVPALRVALFRKGIDVTAMEKRIEVLEEVDRRHRETVNKLLEERERHRAILDLARRAGIK
jgi:hypothetical protein